VKSGSMTGSAGGRIYSYAPATQVTVKRAKFLMPKISADRIPEVNVLANNAGVQRNVDATFPCL